MESVLEEVRKAEEQQNKKKSSRHRFTKAVALVWTTAVNKINTFSKVIDVVVSSHPEYAALVWGSMKFLFLVSVTVEIHTNTTEILCLGDLEPPRTCEQDLGGFLCHQ
jgi:hypothetical protein